MTWTWGFAKPQDGALVGHSSTDIKLGKLPVQGHIKEGFFHGQIRQGELLLHEVDAQHGLQRKGRAAVLAFGVIRGNEIDQHRPGNDALHLAQKLLLARSSGAQAQIKAALLYGCQGCLCLLTPTKHGGGFCRIFLRSFTHRNSDTPAELAAFHTLQQVKRKKLRDCLRQHQLLPPTCSNRDKIAPSLPLRTTQEAGSNARKPSPWRTSPHCTKRLSCSWCYW